MLGLSPSFLVVHPIRLFWRDESRLLQARHINVTPRQSRNPGRCRAVRVLLTANISWCSQLECEHKRATILELGG